MTTLHDVMQVGVGMPERERFGNFARNMLGFPVLFRKGRITESHAAVEE